MVRPAVGSCGCLRIDMLDIHLLGRRNDFSPVFARLFSMVRRIIWTDACLVGLKAKLAKFVSNSASGGESCRSEASTGARGWLFEIDSATSNAFSSNFVGSRLHTRLCRTARLAMARANDCRSARAYFRFPAMR